MEVKRYYSLDLLKWIMSIVVIAQHTRPFERIDNALFLRCEAMLFSLSVPTFFVCTGFFLFRERGEGRKELALRVKRYALRALRLYLLWTAVYLPCTFYGYFTDGKGVLVDLYLLVQGTVLGGSHFYSWHLWYLLAVFYGGAILYLLIRRGRSARAIFLAATVLFLMGVTMSEIVDAPSSLPAGIVRTFESGRMFAAPLYLVLGGWLARRKAAVSARAAAAVAVTAFLAGTLRIPLWSDFMTVLATAGIVSLALAVVLKPSPVWKFLDRASKINYYLHMMFVFLYTLCFREFAYYGWDVFLAAVAGCLAISLLPAVKKKGKDV